MPLGFNRVLGDPTTPAATRPHRVAIAAWPTMVKDPRTETLDALLGHLASAGYEGLEFAPGSFMRYFPGDSAAAVAKKARGPVEKAGLKVFGATLHLGDAALRKLHWIDGVVDDMKLIQDLGGEFASFQYEIHPDYYNTGGAYREDEEYLKWCAETVATLREKAWGLGMNFYLEVHVDRITEDPAALCRILEMASCEINGDLSHFLFRGFTKGKHVKKVLDHMGHTHVRMARFYGDLSAAVDDPKADWEAKGATWGLFQLMKGGLAGGLSSRTISGETGPMHLVKNALAQDATLVPLYRAMARYADAAAQGIAMKVDEPGDLKPWG
ncbi:MAG: TIM barrel protein [Planctomycetota bacterium]|nr:TIM barrel protein [Planctomycetota bacterium]